MSERVWQPISTAPTRRLGEQAEPVLLFGPHLGIQQGRAARYGSDYLFAGVAHIAGNLVPDGDVTHWMPLPSPPTSEPPE